MNRRARYAFRRTVLSACVMTVVALGHASAAPSPDDVGLVDLIVTVQQPDARLPWQNLRPDLRTGYAVRVTPECYLTTESLVRNAALVEIRDAETGEKIPAGVLLSDPERNLAFVQPAVPANLSAVPVTPLATDPLDGEVSIVQYDETSRMRGESARVLNVAVADLPSAPYPALTFRLLSDVSINGEGAAVVHDGTLCGLVMHYNSSTREAEMLPYVTMQAFLDDVQSPPYRGCPSAGIVWKALIDPVKRRRLGVTERGVGILVLACLPDTGADGVLQEEDVVTVWDGHRVDNQGYIQDPVFGRLRFPYLIRRRSPGDTVAVTVIRNGERREVSVTLSRWSDGNAYIPENVTNRRLGYIVEGGLVIRELTGRYLRSYGADWERIVDPRLAQLYFDQRHRPPEAGDRVVILSGILPDAINIGYQGFRDVVVDTVNGQAVHNLGHVMDILASEGHIHRIGLRSMGVDLMLDANGIEQANRRIAAAFRVPQLRFDSRQNEGTQ